jgi:hypothetical protein
MIARIVTLVFCLSCFFSSPVFAWNATGHMLVAKLAYDQLVPQAKAEVDRLTATFTTLYPAADNFITGSVWADDIRSHDITAFSTWHYIDIPIYENASLPKITVDPHNAAWAITEAEKVLAAKNTNSVERAVALNFYLHFMGDIHQPLHCSTWVSERTPDGDKGGNAFPVKHKDFHNLHSLWDSAAGLFSSVARPLTPASEAELNRLANLVIAQSGGADLTVKFDPKAIAQEGNELAIRAVYSDIAPNDVPSAAYLSRAQQESSKQVVLAGKRLAERLNCLLAKVSCPKAA